MKVVFCDLCNAFFYEETNRYLGDDEIEKLTTEERCAAMRQKKYCQECEYGL